MQRGAFEPCPIIGSKVEIDDGCEAEGQIGARYLCAIGSPEVRMRVDGIIIQGSGVADMHMGIDQAGDEKTAGSVYPPRLRRGDEICADFSDPAVAEHNRSVEKRGGALRGDQRDVFDDGGLVNYGLGVGHRSNIQNDEDGQVASQDL